MCLGIPGQVVEWIERDPVFARANVDFSGVAREVHMAFASEADVGDYVIVHAGIAICIVDQSDAQRTLDDLAVLDQLELDDESVQ